MSGIPLERVRKTIDRYRLLDKGDRLIVGVSAGVDSMVLLHLLNAYRQALNLHLIVAHVNHGLRPDESEKEAELVQKESERLGLPFEYGRFDVKEFQKTGGFSLQDAARRIRFHFFNHLLKKHDAQKIALGHNADDQVETILLRLIRGSGLKGLKGMHPIREGRVIRPLLEVWRREIESFAVENRIPYLLDSSNLKENYLRNRIRLSLIPRIEKEYQPDFKGVMAKASTILREEDDYLEKGAGEAYQRIVSEEEGALFFRCSEFQSLHKALQWRVVQKMLGKMDTEKRAVEEAGWAGADQIYQRLVHPSSSFLLELPRGLYLEKRYDKVSLKKGMVKPIPPFEIELVVPGHSHIEAIEKEVLVEEIIWDGKPDGLHGSLTTAFLDYQNLKPPLTMRNFRPGDRFQPFGTGGGTQKLKKFFIDHKVPKFERPKIPLLVSGEMIAWVVGYRIDERVKVTEKTRRVLKVQVV